PGSRWWTAVRCRCRRWSRPRTDRRRAVRRPSSAADPAARGVAEPRPSAPRLRALRAEPLEQRVPLLPVGPREIRRQLVDAEAALVRPDVVLRLAQSGDVRDLELRQVLVELLEDQRIVAHAIRDERNLRLLVRDLRMAEQL